jgi:carbonic anhydrase
MRKNSPGLLLTLFIVLYFVNSASLFASQPDWQYDKAGKWGELSPDYSLCSTGKNQSPINIDTKKTAKGAKQGIKFNYAVIAPDKIVNNGKLIQVLINSGVKKPANIQVDGREFILKRLDFHIPSEHTLDKQHYPMEIEFIHQSKDGKLANVSLFAVPGRPDRTLRKLIQQLPVQAGEANALAENALRNTEMKKKFANYYRYSGSLSSPPCTEGVHWFIMKQPLTFSKEQYQAFKTAIKKDNNRPVQDLNARIILE